MLNKPFLVKIKEFDLSVLTIITLICSIGFCMLYSAAGGSFEPWAEKQMLRFVIGLFLLGGIALPSLLVLRQPSLGTVMIFAATGAAMIFVVGIRYWKVLTALGAILAGLPILWSQMHTYQKNRVLTFLNPESDPLGTGYHILQ